MRRSGELRHEANTPTRITQASETDRGGDIGRCATGARCTACRICPIDLAVVIGGAARLARRRCGVRRTGLVVGRGGRRDAAGARDRVGTSGGHSEGPARARGRRFHFGVPDLQGFLDRGHCRFGRILVFFGLLAMSVVASRYITQRTTDQTHGRNGRVTRIGADRCAPLGAVVDRLRAGRSCPDANHPIGLADRRKHGPLRSL